MTKSRSPRESEVGASSGARDDRPGYEGEEGRRCRSLEPVRPADACQIDRQPERDEHRDLGERRQALLERLRFLAVRPDHVTEQQAGNEDGEEA